MRLWWTAAVAVAVLTAGAASAQPRPGQGGLGQGRGGVAFLLAMPALQEELKLSDEQKEELKKVRESDDAKALQEAMRGMRGLSEEERAAKIKELAPKREAVEKKTLAVLKEDQVKRVKQIQRQTSGIEAFADEEVQKELKLSDEQKDKLKKLATDAREEMADLRKDAGGDFQAMMEKMTKLRKETMTKATGVLTDDQKKAWKDLTGAPFEMRFGGPGGRPGGPGGERPRRPGTDTKKPDA
jgi:hypothetical protein